MKTLLLLVLIAAGGFLYYRQTQQTLTDERAQRAAEVADATKQIDELKQAKDKISKERDDARRQVVALNVEVGRLTNSTPKPSPWFEKRLEQGSARLDAPPSAAGTVRPHSVTAPQQ